MAAASSWQTQTPSAGTRAPSQGPEDLRICTFNIGGNRDRAYDSPEYVKTTQEAMHEMMQSFQPNVICLQEISAKGLSLVEEILNTNPMTVWKFMTIQDDNRLAIFWDTGFWDQILKPLGGHEQPACLNAQSKCTDWRKILRVVLRKGDRRYHIACIHNMDGKGIRKLRTNSKIKVASSMVNQQWQQLRAMIPESALASPQDHDMWAMCGDWNPNAKEMKQIWEEAPSGCGDFVLFFDSEVDEAVRKHRDYVIASKSCMSLEGSRITAHDKAHTVVGAVCRPAPVEEVMKDGSASRADELLDKFEQAHAKKRQAQLAADELTLEQMVIEDDPYPDSPLEEADYGGADDKEDQPGAETKTAELPKFRSVVKEGHVFHFSREVAKEYLAKVLSARGRMVEQAEGESESATQTPIVFLPFKYQRDLQKELYLKWQERCF